MTKGRIGYGVRPPYIHLGDAVEIIRRIHEDAGGSVSEDQLSTLFGNSVKSSSFQLKLMSLKAFGLVSQSGKRIALSPTGQGIVAATSPDQRISAYKSAFLNIDTYKTLYELWAGRILPADEFFLNTLQTRCHIPAELTKRWRESFMQSGNAAGLFQDRPDGRIQLRQDPIVDATQSVMDETPTTSQGGDTTEERQLPVSMQVSKSGAIQKFQIPLSGGKIGAIELPLGWTQSDVKKMIRVIDAMFVASDEEAKT